LTRLADIIGLRWLLQKMISVHWLWFLMGFLVQRQRISVRGLMMIMRNIYIFLQEIKELGLILPSSTHC
jgi:hypothetical protein